MFHDDRGASIGWKILGKVLYRISMNTKTQSAGFLLLAVMCFVCDLPGAVNAADSWIPDRRRDQFPRESGYAVFPYLFDLPGIGAGYGVLGAVNNVGGTCTDIAGTFFEGDVSGQAFGLDSIQLVPQTLILDIGGAYITSAAIQSYSQRGMATDKNSYSVAEISDMLGTASRLTATFLDRRLEAYIAYYGNQGRLAALRDPDGNIIVQTPEASSKWVGTDVVGGRVDLTDDYLDPRRGLRFEPSLWWTPASRDAADYLFLDASVTAYFPVGKRSVWAFNYLRSESFVMQKGESDPYVVARDEGLDYGAMADERERQYIDNLVAANTHGSATSLGGISRLRSYPEGRYQGAHTEFVGTEFRWNITDEVKPFNLFFVKDVRTAVQVAPFYEIGTVTDDVHDLWSITRSSYGVGLRIVTGSGLICRFDLAAGEEGFQPSIFFQYPWEL